MESFSYEGSCFVLNTSCYSYWFVEENEKLKFVIITLYLFHGKKDKLSKTTQSSHFLSSSDGNEIQNYPLMLELGFCERQDCDRKQILFVLFLQRASLCLVM